MAFSVLLGGACDPGGNQPNSASSGGSSSRNGDGDGVGGAGRLESTPASNPPQKLDLLFMVDNSLSMDEKQAVLALGLPDLLAGLTNPSCVDAAGNAHPAPSAQVDCPQGQRRSFGPVVDLHLGFISSSLGDVGANLVCPPEGSPRYRPERIDLAHLLGSLERGQGLAGNPSGFLEWNSAAGDVGPLATSAQQMLRAVGAGGCGWEMSLESWYRFLVDPMPYRSLVRVPCAGSSAANPKCVEREKSGDQILLDDTLLAQRAAFLRPDSTLMIVMLSDENDCSTQVGNMSWLPLDVETTQSMLRGTSACEGDPNSKCCYTCSTPTPEGCSVDPACVSSDPQVTPNHLPRALDGSNLRCYEQRRRFGTEFLYPTQRYVNALTQAKLCWSAADLALDGCPGEDVRDNPLFADGRDPSHVVLAGVVGVPWQAIAADRDSAGNPLAAEQLRYKTSTELNAPSDATWSQILGSPGVRWQAASAERAEVASVARTLPALPQMIESEVPRAGVVNGNAINGRDFDTVDLLLPAGGPGDLEYACIYPLAEPIDCMQRDPNVDNCGCYQDSLKGPTCEQAPGLSSPGTTQYWGRAYPGLRHLQVLKDVGENAVVASICPRNTSDDTRPDFGMRPALSALLARLEALSKR